MVGQGRRVGDNRPSPAGLGRHDEFFILRLDADGNGCAGDDAGIHAECLRTGGGTGTVSRFRTPAIYGNLRYYLFGGGRQPNRNGYPSKRANPVRLPEERDEHLRERNERGAAWQCHCHKRDTTAGNIGGEGAGGSSLLVPDSNFLPSIRRIMFKVSNPRPSFPFFCSKSESI